MKITVPRLPLLLAAGLLSLGTARAQQAVPNGALETWVTRNGGDAPAQWLTTDDALQQAIPIPGLPASGTVIKSTVAHGGGFAAQLSNQSFPAVGTVPGLILLGNRLGNINRTDSLEQLGGLPFTTRPVQMQFYYRFTGTVATPADRPVASVLLTKTSGGVQQVVAAGRLYLPTTATSYTLATIPLKYKAGFAPDSIHIAFGSGDFNDTDFTTGNTLLVDDVTLTGIVAATRDAQLQAAVSVYPNPSASGRFTLDAAQEPALLAAPLTVTDALGRVVLRQAVASAAGRRVVDLGQRPAGVYSLRLDTPRGPVVHQLLIQ